MKRVSDYVHRHRIVLTGLLLVAATYLVMFLALGLYPFGDKLIAGGDTIERYIPFLQELRRKLCSAESLSYTWSGALGTDFYSVAPYYLGSPINLLLVFLPVKMMYKVLNLLFVCKAFLAFYAMYYYCTRRKGITGNRSDAWENIVFAYAYAMSNVFLSYRVNFSLQDCMIVLPFVMLGLECWVQKGKWRLYTVSLTLLLLCNYYIGFMACIFIMLYYLTLQFQSFRIFVQKSLKILGYSVIAIGISACIWFPVLHVIENKTLQFSDCLGWGFFTDWFAMLRQMWFYNIPDTSSDVWGADMYIGILMVLLTVAFYVNKQIPLLTRIKKLALCAVLVISLNEQMTNWVAHLFHYTSNQSNRQMLFLLFLCLSLSQESFLKLKKDEKCVAKWQLPVITLLLSVLLLFCLVQSDVTASLNQYMYSFDLLVLYCILLSLKRKKNELRRFVFIVGGLAVVELGMNAYHAVSSSADYSVSELIDQWNETAQILTEIPEDDTLYTVEDNAAKYNYGFLNGCHSVNISSPLLGQDYRQTLAQLGAKTSANKIQKVTSSQLLQLLCNVKYVIQDATAAQDLFAGAKQVASTEDLAVYENVVTGSPIVLTSGDLSAFTEQIQNNQEVERSFADVDNALCQDLCGSSDLYQETEVEVLSASGENCTAVLHNGIIIASQYMQTDGDTEAGYDANQDSVVTLQLKSKDTGYLYMEDDYVTSLGKVEANQETTVQVTIEPQDFSEQGLVMMTPDFYILNTDTFDTLCETLQTNAVTITDWADDSIVGETTCESSQTAVAMMAYDDNWNVTVDGQQVKLQKIAGTFLGFEVSGGTHTIVMQYSNPYRLYGMVIACISLLILVGLMIWENRRNNK